MFPCSVRVGDLFFCKRVAGKLERINEGQITAESVEEFLFFGYAAWLCPKEFVAEKPPKLRTSKAVGIQRAMVGPYVQYERDRQDQSQNTNSYRPTGRVEDYAYSANRYQQERHYDANSVYRINSILSFTPG